MKLYDGEARAKKTTTSKDTARRAAEMDAVLQEVGEADAASARLGAFLGRQAAVQKIHYDRFRPAGSFWQLEYARVGEDLVVQCIPLRPERVDWQTVVTRMIGAIDGIIPRSLVVEYAPPKGAISGVSLAIKFYTIRFKDCIGLPGWMSAQSHILDALAKINAWS